MLCIFLRPQVQSLAPLGSATTPSYSYRRRLADSFRHRSVVVQMDPAPSNCFATLAADGWFTDPLTVQARGEVGSVSRETFAAKLEPATRCVT